jgi:hypothetical protein
MHFDFPMKVPEYASAIDACAHAAARVQGSGVTFVSSSRRLFPRDAFLRVVGPI